MKELSKVAAFFACIALVGSGLFIGCDNKTDKAEPATHQIATVDGAKPVATFRVKINPKVTYQGKETSYQRTVEHVRAVSPFGVSAGEVISKQQPFTHDQSPSPEFAIGPDGIGQSRERDGGSFGGGGGKWTWWDTLKVWVSDWAWIGLLGGGIILALYMLVPAAGPVISGVFRLIASAIPFLGSLVENAFAKLKLKKPLVEVIEGGQKFKDTLRADESLGLTSKQKEAIIQMFTDSQIKAQDNSSQTVVKTIKAQG